MKRQLDLRIEEHLSWLLALINDGSEIDITLKFIESQAEININRQGIRLINKSYVIKGIDRGVYRKGTISSEEFFNSLPAHQQEPLLFHIDKILSIEQRSRIPGFYLPESIWYAALFCSSPFIFPKPKQLPVKYIPERKYEI
tara:strand:- start:239 stop:664 length:426 start_codon:yes stop_codon:yes gene_type:complete